MPYIQPARPDITNRKWKVFTSRQPTNMSVGAWVNPLLSETNVVYIRKLANLIACFRYIS